MKRLRMRTFFSILLLTALLSVTSTCLLLDRQPTAALPAQSAAVEAEAADPLTRFRTQREQLLRRQKGELNDVIYNSSGDPEAVAMAQRQLLGLLTCEEREQSIRGILESRGFEDVLAVVSDQSANILLRSPGALSRRDTAVILDLVMRETGLTGGNVKIIPIN